MNGLLRKIELLVLLTCGYLQAFPQGQIEHIKNQAYLKQAKSVDCTNPAGDNLSERICANLAFQKSDSLLTMIYDSLLHISKDHYIDSLKDKIIAMQAVWRDLRDKQCEIVYDHYEGCGGCHQRSIDYLNCLRELTETRTNELRRMYDSLTTE